VEYADYYSRLAEVHPAIADQLAGIKTLERLFGWFERLGIPLASLDMVTQDEYCHDLIVPLPGDREWIVFGLT
jgi:hypothetical protein